MNSKGWNIITYKNISVFSKRNLDGGGTSFGQAFIPVVKSTIGKVNRICEFGSGPGFIGFSLLANNLCDSLCLIDVNPEAIKACNKTIKENHLEDKVKVYLSDSLKNVPENEKWDLVVSNPPHLEGNKPEHKSNILLYDFSWKIHKSFYKDVKKHLRKGGSIIFQEAYAGATPKFWKKIIEENGLKYKKSFEYQPSLHNQIGEIVKLLYSRLGFNIGKYISYFLSHQEPLLKLSSDVVKQKHFHHYFIWSTN